MNRALLTMTFLAAGFQAVHAQWTRYAQLPPTEFATIHSSAGSLLAASANTVYASTDDGMQWVTLKAVHDSVDFISHVERIGTRLIAGTYKYGIFESTDAGTSWTRHVSGLDALGAMDIDELAVRGDSLYLGTVGGGVYVSPLSSTNQWSAYSDNLPSRYAWTMNCLYNDRDTLIAGAGASATMYRNVPGVRAWEEYTFAPFNPAGTAFYAASRLGQVLLGAGTQGLYRSSDGGRTWGDHVDPGIGFISDANFASTSSTIFVNLQRAATSHLFFSRDSGATWFEALGSPMPLTYKIASSGEKLLAARIDGLWWQDVNTTGVILDGGLPERTTLDQNYPNPFNPSTRIRFSLPSRAHISLVVYDILGRQVATLAEGSWDAGRHEVSWNAHNAAAGTYVCRLRTNGFSQARAMLLVR